MLVWVLLKKISLGHGSRTVGKVDKVLAADRTNDRPGRPTGRFLIEDSRRPSLYAL